MYFLRRITSLSNLNQAKLSGQVATILILIMLGALIFVLSTINLGNVSVKTTQVANATDSSLLQLASQLASKSNYLWKQLGESTKKCKKGGILGIILAIIFAVIGTLIFPGVGTAIGAALGASAASAAIVGAAVLGAIGGAIGGAIVHGTLQGAAMGALQGAAIGATIGWAAGPTTVSAGETIPAGTTATVTTESATITGDIATSSTGFSAVLDANTGMSFSQGATITAGSGPAMVMSGSVLVPTTTTMMIAYTSLLSGASIYNAVIQEKNNEATMAALAKSLSGLPEYEGAREGVFFHALSQVVDDPNKVEDTLDLDGDGDFKEKVPYFTYWWDNHIKEIKASIKSNAELIEDFMEGTFIPFYKQTKYGFLPYTDRQEVECACSPGEGSLLELFRTLEGSKSKPLFRTLDPGSNYDLGFWEPGPSKSALLEWYNSNCDDCPPPKGFDKFDGTRLEMEEFIDYSQGILNEDEECHTYNYDPDELDRQLKPGCAGENEQWDWFDFLYCQGSSCSGESKEAPFYCTFSEIAKEMQDWIEELEDVRNGLPACQLRWGPYTNDYVKLSDKFCQCYPSLEERKEGKVGIFPCNWLKDYGCAERYACGEPHDTCDLKDICEKKRPGNEGINLPNPVCKIDGKAKSKLLDQIAVAKEFVSNLENYIKNKYFCGGNPCPSQCGNPAPACKEDAVYCICGQCAGSDCGCSTTSLDIKIKSVCLTGSVGEGNAVITYEYEYELVCESCVLVTSCDEQGGNCTSSCQCTQTVYSGTASGADCIPTPDLYINQVDCLACTSEAECKCPTKERMLEILSDFESFLESISSQSGKCYSANVFATIDQDPTDEFFPNLDILSCEIGEINHFLNGLKDFADKLNNEGGLDNRATDGAGSITYPWKDSQGAHAVTVETGPFKFAWVEKTKHGNILVGKTCLELRDYCDNLLGCPSNYDCTWVKITRQDPGEKEIPSASKKVNLGLKWNSAFSALIKRLSKAYYSFNKVGIKAIK